MTRNGHFWPFFRPKVVKSMELTQVLYIFEISTSSRFERCVYLICCDQTKWNDQKRSLLTIFSTESGQIDGIDPSVIHIWNQLVKPVRMMCILTGAPFTEVVFWKITPNFRTCFILVLIRIKQNPISRSNNFLCRSEKKNLITCLFDFTTFTPYTKSRITFNNNSTYAVRRRLKIHF